MPIYKWKWYILYIICATNTTHQYFLFYFIYYIDLWLTYQYFMTKAEL